MLKYYKDLRNNNLFAYEKNSDFFVFYDTKLNEWHDSNITFYQVMHDYVPMEVSEEIVVRETNGNLPKAELESYLLLLKRLNE